MSYRDATNSDWKLIIDQWIAKGRDEQRGAIFTTDPEKIKHRGKNGGAAKRLSPFWRKAFKTLRKLKLELIEEKQIGNNRNSNCKSRTNMGGTPNRNDTVNEERRVEK